MLSLMSKSIRKLISMLVNFMTLIHRHLTKWKLLFKFKLNSVDRRRFILRCLCSIYPAISCSFSLFLSFDCFDVQMRNLQKTHYRSLRVNINHMDQPRNIHTHIRLFVYIYISICVLLRPFISFLRTCTGCHTEMLSLFFRLVGYVYEFE